MVFWAKACISRPPVTPAAVAPRPPSSATIFSEVWKSRPSPPRVLVRAKDAEGARNSGRVHSTDGFLSRASTSPTKAPKLSLASLRSAGGQAIAKNSGRTSR